ncbi:FAD-dependent oxidoreductase, partial [Arthrospira platensis SPKY1]|nr:FAD-dependent oxidoreductase [Arthrospira platensis SPKY1]
MINRHILKHGIDLRLQTELKEIWGDRNGKLKLVVTSQGEKIECGFVGIATGVRPNIDFLQFTPIEYDKGILVNDYLETSIPDVYAVGDCAQLRTPKPGRRAIEPVWYTGRMMGEVVAKNILEAVGSGRVAYDPGIWFNSAKFLDIEYQVYGNIQPRLPDGQA